MKIEWTLPAQEALREIFAYIAEEDPAAAHNLVDLLIDGTETVLGEHPHAGRPGRVADTREWVAHKNYVMAYRVLGDSVQILAVVHSTKLWPSDFSS